MNVPNPPMVTRRPLLRESNTLSTNASSARSAETLEPPDAFAMAATRSAFVMAPYLLDPRPSVKSHRPAPRGDGSNGRNRHVHTHRSRHDALHQIGRAS